MVKSKYVLHKFNTTCVDIEHFIRAAGSRNSLSFVRDADYLEGEKLCDEIAATLSENIRSRLNKVRNANVKGHELVGKRVVVTGSDRGDLNGKTRVPSAYDEETGTYTVRV